MNSKHFWKNMIHVQLKKVCSDSSKISDLNSSDYQVIKRVFQGAEGSWIDLSGGDPREYKLLRKCCKVFLKRRRRKGERPYD